LCFFVTGRARPHLRLEPFALVLRVIELGESVRDLPTVDVGLEPLDKTRVVAVGLGQRGNVAGKSGDVDRLYQGFLDARGGAGFVGARLARELLKTGTLSAAGAAPPPGP